jgi:hypothetical protein
VRPQLVSVKRWTDGPLFDSDVVFRAVVVDAGGGVIDEIRVPVKVHGSAALLSSGDRLVHAGRTFADRLAAYLGSRTGQR